MKILDVEKEIGIKTYFTPFEGTGGKLRSRPEDFFVEEISIYPKEGKEGKFTIAEVESINWENNHLIRELSNYLHISRKRINFAGTKDKRAKTKQLMSFYKVPIEKISSINLKDVNIKNIYYSNHPVKIGNLIGNKFKIKVRNIDKDLKEEKIKKIIDFITKNSGFPNFYGIQRFGMIRPITHIVGKYIVKDDFEKAVMTYIANPIKAEKKDNYLLREKLEKTRDYKSALKNYPNELNYEKAMLNKLVIDPHDFIAALKELPKNLLTMFIYAYQSFLFNEILSERIKRKIPINKAIYGDIIIPIRRGMFDSNTIFVKDSNIDKVNYQISKGKAVVSGVLFGSDSIFSEGEMGKIEREVIKKEGIDPRDFIIPDIPFISSSGSRHPLLSYVKNLDFKFSLDDINKDKKLLTLDFELQKGSYATSLLREFIKSDDIRNY